MTDVETSVPEEVEDVHVPTSWEFFAPPETAEVMKKLSEMPEVWGVRQVEYVEYVQPLSQSKNISQEKGVKDYRNVWTLYFTVAGRLAMLNQAAGLNGWEIDFEPEPVTPTGVPGYLVNDGERIVYREYCVIRYLSKGIGSSNPEWRTLGRRSGTAWVPATGGAQAVATNRYEKVETSARGRAIAAWGFGVLPGSGIASLEEMRGANENVSSGRATRQRQEPEQPKATREELEEHLRAAITEFEQVTGQSSETVDERVRNYVGKNFGKTIGRWPMVDDTTEGPWDFRSMKDGEVVLFLNRMRGMVQEAKQQRAEI